jgi:hypothetical protein
VTIGSGIPPGSGSLLDLKESAPNVENATSAKGLLHPRVKLTDKDKLFPMFDGVSGADYVKGATHYVKADADSTHIGLTVFNVNETEVFTAGLHFWDGTEWRKMDYGPVIEPQIVALIGASAIMTPNFYTVGVLFNGILRVPYIGGNGGYYPGTAATPIPLPGGHNLSIERIAGKLAMGSGEVMYRISGTPNVQSPVLTTFSIEFLGLTTSISVGGGLTSIYLKNLQGDTNINFSYTYNDGYGGHPKNPPTTAIQLNFGTIIIPETGSYAFNLRLYGKLSDNVHARIPFYVYLQKNSLANVIDAAEMDLVTSANVYPGYQDYSYSIILGGVFNAGETVMISMHKSRGNPAWNLVSNSSLTDPVRTSLVYWKL